MPLYFSWPDQTHEMSISWKMIQTWLKNKIRSTGRRMAETSVGSPPIVTNLCFNCVLWCRLVEHIIGNCGRWFYTFLSQWTVCHFSIIFHELCTRHVSLTYEINEVGDLLKFYNFEALGFTSHSSVFTGDTTYVRKVCQVYHFYQPTVVSDAWFSCCSWQIFENAEISYKPEKHRRQRLFGGKTSEQM